MYDVAPDHDMFAVEENPIRYGLVCQSIAKLAGGKTCGTCATTAEVWKNMPLTVLFNLHIAIGTLFLGDDIDDFLLYPTSFFIPKSPLPRYVDEFRQIVSDAIFMKILLGVIHLKNSHKHARAFKDLRLPVFAGKKGPQAADFLFVVRRYLDLGERWRDFRAFALRKGICVKLSTGFLILPFLRPSLGLGCLGRI